MAMVQAKSIKYRVWATHGCLLFFLALIIVPLLMVLAISFRQGNFAVGDLIPKHPTLNHWKLALGIPVVDEQGIITPPPFPVLQWLGNSVKVAGCTAALVVLLSTSSAYAFARLRFKGKGLLLKLMLIIQMFPPVLALVAIYVLFDKIGTYIPFWGHNTHSGLILAQMGCLALHIWTIKGYFETIETGLEEAAAIDGATPFQAFRLILLPLSVPILAVVFILAFIQSITEVPIASILLQDVDQLTLAVGAQQYLYAQNYLWGDFAAAAVLSGIPIALVFLLAQRWIIGGLTSGGIKG